MHVIIVLYAGIQYAHLQRKTGGSALRIDIAASAKAHHLKALIPCHTGSCLSHLVRVL